MSVPVAEAKQWNILPTSVKNCSSFSTFMPKVKANLFHAFIADFNLLYCSSI